jgi:hypothetical protein
MLAPVSRCPPRFALILSLATVVAGATVSHALPAKPPRPPAGVAAAAAPVATATPTAAAAPLELASQRLAEGRAGEAWDLLSPLETRYGGDPEFDYLLALAALDSGRPAAALAPLRRVLDLEPRFDGARLELARALVASGDVAGARREYEAIAQLSPSETSRTAAQRALVLLAGGASPVAAGTPGRHAAALVAGAGYDSNANASTSDSLFGFALDPRAVQQDSPFVEVGGSLRSEFSPAPRWGLVTLLRAGHRLNPDAGFVDQTALDASVGLNGRLGKWTTGFAASVATGWLDGEAFFRSGYLEASASRPLSARWELVGVGRVAQFDYLPDRFELLDVRRYVWGGALQRRTTAAGIPSFGAAVLGGRDAVLRAGSPFSNDRYGMRLFAAHALDARRAVFGELAWLTSDFFGARGFLGLDRLDRQTVAAVGLEARDWPVRGWRTVPQLRYTDNRSNVALFQFDRFEASVFVRREFH